MYARMRLMALIFCIIALSVQWAGAQAEKTSDGLSLVVTSVDVNDKILKLQYEIRNNSKNDAWIFLGTSNWDSVSAEVFMGEDVQTLIIRERLDLAFAGSGPPAPLHGKYIRLRSGKIRNESILLKIPVNPEITFARKRRQYQGFEYATRLAIELGYYPGNLPEISPIRSSAANEDLTWRDDEFLIYHPGSKPKEQVLRTVIDNLHIPYEEKEYKQTGMPKSIINCTKLEIQYEPSMLEYFFPYDSQQSLLSPDEIKYLSSDKIIVIEKAQDIRAFAYEVSKEHSIIGPLCIARYHSEANVRGDVEGKPPIFYSICDNCVILSEKRWFRSLEGLAILKKLTPQIQPINLRMQCAENLKNQWYRFHSYNIREAKQNNDPSLKNVTIYPRPTLWCDDIYYNDSSESEIKYLKSEEGFKLFGKLFMCPSAGEGKCHYAMNPNCEPNSPGDMVLLFETRAGWNQHGGQELFTFENHDPKGGCVLLNDGTVKFIRTENELHTLRWK
jgi:hypothetical protein